MGIVKGVVLTVLAATLIGQATSACGSFGPPDPRNYGIVNVVKKGDELNSFTGQIGTCDVSGFLMQDKELLWVHVSTADGDNVVPGGIELTRLDKLTGNLAVRHSCDL